ncbi:MAG: carbon-nitrogen hydrolase family protein [Bacteroidales bacterium]|nr:carbon-nitrogen hydrolase family protein [Bacteroidales bacterium]
MRIAIVQLRPVKGDIEKNLENHIIWIKQALKQKADMVVFPELSLTGYEPELAAELATSQEDKRLDVLQNISDKNNIIIGAGLPTREGDNLFVSMILFRPGQRRTTYSKQYLYPTEESVFTPGKNPLVLEYGSDIIAPAICYELSNPGHHKFAISHHANIYLASVMNSVSGVDADIQQLSELAKAHHMVTFMANYVGISAGYECAGKSSVWNEKGELIAQLGTKEEGIILFDSVNRETLKFISQS